MRVELFLACSRRLLNYFSEICFCSVREKQISVFALRGFIYFLILIFKNSGSIIYSSK